MQYLRFFVIRAKSQQQLPARQFQLQFLSQKVICYFHEVQFDLPEISQQVQLLILRQNTHLIRHLLVQAI